MASSINADNGVVSGSSGLKSTADTSGVLALQSNGSTGVTLDTSLNVGVGTTSPVARLTSKASANTYSGGSLALQGAVSGTSYLTNAGGIFYISNDGSTDQFVLNASGNLGLGTAPSAWYSSAKVFQIGNGLSLWSSANTNAVLSQNLYLDATATYRWITANPATNFSQINGSFVWQLAAGTPSAGGAIGSFNTYMTLDANGLLQVGATSPINSGAVTFASTGGTYNQLELCDTRAYSSTPNSSLGFAVKYNSAGSYTNMAAIVGTKENATDGNYSGALLFYTSLNGSGSAERARINSSGDLLLGISSANAVNGITFASLGASTPYGLINQSASGTLMFFRYNSTTVGSITQNTTSTTYATSSDYRLKNTIAPMTGALAKVAQLKPCTYKWNADGSDGEGFIAHELAEVVPQCVTGEKDAVETYVDEDGNEQTRPVYQGIDTSFLVATLTAAIQELKAEFDAYKASHP